ncbi:SDR family NAD(P)-dependent oxidoreductase [Novosphingobium sp. P6W]|uniref:SDR family NAD(P)-dependent oxidoreductase n=1 Tax=Novosphingobium sp. P6W TaxID=1609758 RepID=UPI0005C2E319|nr:SDR family oxidoreductase [Novosphingobium sp. P6W]AXB78719.1 SDR family NAD(P)-dependent oxidoreductase [Novosphingobium sp. P6W]KIS31738.1 oxidoreductase [Novosphingobium sp. P6W]
MKGRTVLYTGAAGGLGLDTTLLLIERGAHVIALDNDAEKIARLVAAAQGRGPGRLTVSQTDLADLAGLRTALDALVQAHGGIDVVINNAAVYPSKPFEDYTVEEHQFVQRINVDAGIVAVQAALPAMRATGFGRIVNVSSITISGGWANLSPYVASKAALVGLTRAWAREFGAWGVTVNAIAPGAFPTDAEKIHPDPAGYERMVLDVQSIKRRGTATDIAHAIAFFAAEEAGFITGQTLHVNGGWTMS